MRTQEYFFSQGAGYPSYATDSNLTFERFRPVYRPQINFGFALVRA